MFLLRGISLIALSIALISCSTTSSNKKKGPQKVAVFLFADENINKDIYGIPSPTRLTFLQLTTLVEFDQMNEISTNGDPYKTHLGDSVLDEINVTIRPEENLDFKIPLKKETNYLGVIGAFRNKRNDWKLSLERQEPPKFKKNVNYLYVGVREIDIVQLSKDDAVLQITSKDIKNSGKNIEDLSKSEKRKLFKKNAKNLKKLKKKKRKDVSKGLFSLAHTPKPELQNNNVDEKSSSEYLDNNITENLINEEPSVSKAIDYIQTSSEAESEAEVGEDNSTEKELDVEYDYQIENDSDFNKPEIEELKTNADYSQQDKALYETDLTNDNTRIESISDEDNMNDNKTSKENSNGTDIKIHEKTVLEVVTNQKGTSSGLEEKIVEKLEQIESSDIEEE